MFFVLLSVWLYTPVIVHLHLWNNTGCVHNCVCSLPLSPSPYITKSVRKAHCGKERCFFSRLPITGSWFDVGTFKRRRVCISGGNWGLPKNHNQCERGSLTTIKCCTKPNVFQNHNTANFQISGGAVFVKDKTYKFQLNAHSLLYCKSNQ